MVVRLFALLVACAFVSVSLAGCFEQGYICEVTKRDTCRWAYVNVEVETRLTGERNTSAVGALLIEQGFETPNFKEANASGKRFVREGETYFNHWFDVRFEDPYSPEGETVWLGTIDWKEGDEGLPVISYQMDFNEDKELLVFGERHAAEKDAAAHREVVEPMYDAWLEEFQSRFGWEIIEGPNWESAIMDKRPYHRFYTEPKNGSS